MFLFLKSFPRLWNNAFKDLNRHFSVTLSSIFSIAVALFIAAVMIVSALNVDQIADGVQGEFVMQVSISPNINQGQKENILMSISAQPEVVSVSFSSKEEELNTLIAQNGEMFSQYQGSRNPLYDVYLVKVTDLSNIPALQEKLQALEGVVAVNYGGQLVLTLMQIFTGSRIIGYAVIAIMAVLSYFLIRASVRMSIATRADEISIMRQVGAYNWYILTPFVLQGMVIGLAGALIPGLLLLSGYPLLYDAMHGSLVSNLLALIPPYPFVIQIFLGLLAAGLLIGMGGSYVAARQYLKETR